MDYQGCQVVERVVQGKELVTQVELLGSGEEQEVYMAGKVESPLLGIAQKGKDEGEAPLDLNKMYEEIEEESGPKFFRDPDFVWGQRGDGWVWDRKQGSTRDWKAWRKPAVAPVK